MKNIKSVLFYIALASAILVVTISSVYNWDTLLPMGSSYALAFLYSFYPGVFPGVSGSGLSWILYVFLFSLIQTAFNSLSLAQAFIYVFLIFFSVFNFNFLLSYIVKHVFKKVTTVYHFITILFSLKDM